MRWDSKMNVKLEAWMFFCSWQNVSGVTRLCLVPAWRRENTCVNTSQNSPPAAPLPSIIMAFLHHNNAIRSVFYNSSHLCYRCQQSKICHYLHDRDRAFCNYWACLSGNYFSLLNYYKSWKEGREEPRPWAETEIFFRRLKSWETFLGSGIITYTHLPETVDRKYALSAEITTLFSLFLPPPPSFRRHSAPWQSDERQSSPVRDINKSDNPTRAETTYFALRISLARDAVAGVAACFYVSAAFVGHLLWCWWQQLPSW